MESAQRIRLARRHAGLSQMQLAQKVGVRRSAVSHWESANGKNPSVAHLRAIATNTHVHFEWLTTGRGVIHISVEQALDAVSAANAMLVEDVVEMKLIESFRTLPAGARVVLIDLIGMLVAPRGRVSRKGFGLGRSDQLSSIGSPVPSGEKSLPAF